MSIVKKVKDISADIQKVSGLGTALCGAIAMGLYDEGYRKQEWISVDERLPEDDLSEEHNKKTIKVLVAIKAKNGITIRTQERFRDYTYSKVGDPITFWTWRFSHGKVTHWMPLPEPPMMKGGE